MVRLQMINYVFWGILASMMSSVFIAQHQKQHLTYAAGTLIHARSAFVSKNGNDNITFAINNPEIRNSNASSPDLLNYYLSGPIGYSWIGKMSQYGSEGLM